MGYKLIFIDNPHDSNSAQIAAQIEQLVREGKLLDEVHRVPFDEIHGLPIQAAPAMFVLGTDELLTDFTGDAVLNILDFMKRQRDTEQAITDMTALLQEGGIL